MNIGDSDRLSIELTYLAFGAVMTDGRTPPGCVLTQLIGQEGGYRWHVRQTRLSTIAYPNDRYQPSPGTNHLVRQSRWLSVAAQDGLIAFNGFVNDKIGVAVLFTDGSLAFLPVDDPPLYSLVRIEFSGNSRTLILIYALYDPGDRQVLLARYLTWDKQRRLSVIDTVPGWLAHASADHAIMTDPEGKAFTFEYRTRQVSRGSKETAAIEGRLERLLVQQAFPAGQVPGIIRMRNDAPPAGHLPFLQMECVSASLGSLFETYLAEYMPEDLTDPSPNLTKQFWLDGVCSLEAGFVCTIKRMRSAPLRGFQFTNAEGTAFRFLSSGHFFMGMCRPSMLPRCQPSYIGEGIEMTAYPAGIYNVDLVRRTVRHTAQPWVDGSRVTPGSDEEDQLNWMSTSNGYMLMRLSLPTR